MNIQTGVIKKAEELALGRCLYSWNPNHSFEEVLTRIGQNGSVVERTEFMRSKPALVINIIRSTRQELLDFAQEVLASQSVATTK